MEAFLVVLLVAAVLAIFALARRNAQLLTTNADVSSKIGLLQGQLQALRTEFDLRLQAAIAEKEQDIRGDAIKKSHAITIGKALEHFIPYLPSFAYNPKDARFLGTPVDFVVFDGLDAGHVKSIAFVEVKTGTSQLTSRERQIRDAVRQGRVDWIEIRHATKELSQNGLATEAQLTLRELNQAEGPAGPK
jgi:predicted Holliday junction resolvase-like endonuclease